MTGAGINAVDVSFFKVGVINFKDKKSFVPSVLRRCTALYVVTGSPPIGSVGCFKYQNISVVGLTMSKESRIDQARGNSLCRCFGVAFFVTGPGRAGLKNVYLSNPRIHYTLL